MPIFVLAYHGAPQFESRAAGAAHMTAWVAWREGLGSAVVDRGLPLSVSKTVCPDGTVVDGGGPNPLSGYSVVRADSMDEAIGLAMACPHLRAGGSIEIAQALDFPM